MVEIITIGDEILIGQIIDTNSAWMAVELNKAGFEVAQISSIHDDAALIKKTLTDALKRADIVLITGGLGPTKDDLTKKTLCDFFDAELVFDESVLKNIENVFRGRNFVINELTRNQAYVPKNCTVIQNKVGTAPIMWFEKENKIIVSMPGVPYEMKMSMTEEVIPRLQKYFNPNQIILHKTIQVYGIGESILAEQIADWENSLPENLHLAYLPNYGIVKLRISGKGEDELLLESEINQEIEKLTNILGESIIAYEDKSIEQLLGEKLQIRGLTISTSESCTGGNVAHKITSIPGSSDYYKGSVVSYSNEVKMNLLNVSKDDLDSFGAVSQPVVEQMAIGARDLLHTDLSVSVSGIAGPGGGTKEKPVGTVWIGVATNNNVFSELFRFGSISRENIIERSSMAALIMAFKAIQE